jgi:hypothetical protein
MRRGRQLGNVQDRGILERLQSSDGFIPLMSEAARSAHRRTDNYMKTWNSLSKSGPAAAVLLAGVLVLATGCARDRVTYVQRAYPVTVQAPEPPPPPLVVTPPPLAVACERGSRRAASQWPAGFSPSIPTCTATKSADSRAENHSPCDLADCSEAAFGGRQCSATLLSAGDSPSGGECSHSCTSRRTGWDRELAGDA